MKTTLGRIAIAFCSLACSDGVLTPADGSAEAKHEAARAALLESSLSAAAGGGSTGVSGRSGSGSSSMPCPPRTTPYPSPIPPMAQAVRVAEGALFLEGPVWIAGQGVLLMSDTDFSTATQPNGPSSNIVRFSPPSSLEVFIPNANANGLALANDGRVLAATQDTQSLSFFDPTTGARENLRLRYRGQAFNSPNDLAVRSDGNVYFTDPDYAIGPRSSETLLYGVYRVSRRGFVSLVDGRVNRPNGIALSPDERTLYVGGREEIVYRYQLAEDGSVVGERAIFTDSAGESDGLTIDCAGNLYVTSTTVKVFDPNGALLGEIVAGEFATNVAFGGPDQSTLYITSYGELYAIELNVPGRAY